jgi:hypothetical protein
LNPIFKAFLWDWHGLGLSRNQPFYMLP